MRLSFLQAPLDRIRESERRWLRRHGLLDRPWFILASAPGPTVPPGITDRAALICINNAVATAARMGLPQADLTFRAGHKEWSSAAGCRMPLVLWLSDDLLRFYRRKYGSGATVGRFRMMRHPVRGRITTHVLGNDLGAIGEKHKPSTGIFAVLYGLFLGVPEIVLSGVSVDQDGYSYGSLPGKQLHRGEDLFALKHISAAYPSVSTTEANLSRETGIPLYAETRRIEPARMGAGRGHALAD